jgi:hypothetical protein
MSIDSNEKFIDTINQDKVVVDVAKQYGVAPKENKQLGTCPDCGKDVFELDPHVEETLVIVFGDGTGHTKTNFHHLDDCWKFDVK